MAGTLVYSLLQCQTTYIKNLHSVGHIDLMLHAHVLGALVYIYSRHEVSMVKPVAMNNVHTRDKQHHRTVST